MINYKLNQLANKPKGTTVLLPRIQYRLSTEQQYQAVLQRMLKDLAAEVRSSVLPALAAYRRSQRDLVVDEEAWLISFKQVAETLQAIAKRLVNRLLDLESERHTKEFHKAAKRVLGVDISTIVRNEDLEEYLRDAASRNAILIKSLSDDVVKDVSYLVLEAKRNGTSQKQLKAQLQKRFQMSSKRADFIARDQMGSLNSDLNSIRQQQAGVTSYEWDDSDDERVRVLHNEISGRTYKWGKPTDAENGLPPGKPPRCRCTARGIVEF